MIKRGPRVVFDLSNLRAGGGLQVASATLADLCAADLQGRFADFLPETELWISPAVMRNLTVDPGELPGKVVVEASKPSLVALFRGPRPDLKAVLAIVHGVGTVTM